MAVIGQAIQDFVYPRACEVCGGEADRSGRYVCSSCLMRLPFLPTQGCCRRCGRNAPGLDREFVCEDCRTHPPHFDRAFSVLRFETEARRMLLNFKFERHLWLRNDFADWLEGAARTHFDVGQIALTVPMPMTFRHRLLRGYNSCVFLAEALSARLGTPCSGRVLKRIGNPARQGGLSEEDRRKNVIGTFAVTKAGRQILAACAKERPVLVVDDVMTTGSTLSECAKTLKAAGCGTVWCLTLVRSIRG